MVQDRTKQKHIKGNSAANRRPFCKTTSGIVSNMKIHLIEPAKHVVSVTVVSVKTEAASYEHGQTVNILGDVAGGKFSAAWIIPPECAPGIVMVDATQ